MKLRCPTVGILALAVLAGCASVPPENITADRMGYGEVVADSWKRQTLLMILFSLAETGQTNLAPQVTVPAR
jgi:hypothetical protein